MKLEAGQVAVVTGAASGIGRALVDAFAARGLAVVLADVEQGALDAAVEELTATGASALGARVDVRRPEDLENLAAKVQAEFGRVDVLCNNAGVIVPRAPVWEQSYADWQWIVDVNLHGVANGLRAFVPAMVAAGRGHVVNTASMAGLTTIPGGGNGAYSATKHAVVGLSETLRLDLADGGAGHRRHRAVPGAGAEPHPRRGPQPTSRSSFGRKCPEPRAGRTILADPDSGSRRRRGRSGTGRGGRGA